MSRDQIEEMARDIFESGVAIEGIDCAFAALQGADKDDSHFMRMAKHLVVNKGYRKQSEPISCGHEKGGEWIQSRSKFGFGQSNCSICNGYVDGYTSYKYCPHCGAKIQGIRSKEDDEQ